MKRYVVLVLLGAGMLALGPATTALAEVTRVSLDALGNQADDNSDLPAISAEGRYVAFRGSSDMVPGGTAYNLDVFRHDRVTSELRRVCTDSSGVPADDRCDEPSLSANGRYVAFSSQATNLAGGLTAPTQQIYVKDMDTGQLTLASRATSGLPCNNFCLTPRISADGRHVAFYSLATDLVAGDTNGQADVFVCDLRTGVVTRESVAPDGSQTDGPSYRPVISASGQYVAFVSHATNLHPEDADSGGDVFVRERASGQIMLASRATVGGPGNAASDFPTLSQDGRYVAFESLASNLVAEDTNGATDVFWCDVLAGSLRRIMGGDAALNPVQLNGSSHAPAITADGRRVVFTSYADNVVPWPDVAGFRQVYVWDLIGPPLLLASASGVNPGNGHSQQGVVSGDGAVVAFSSDATNLVADDTNDRDDVFVATPAGVLWTCIFRSSPITGQLSVNRHVRPVVTLDGRWWQGSIENHFRLCRADGTPVAGVLTWLRPQSKFQFTPAAPLAANETYRLEITAGARSAADVVLAADDVRVFTTNNQPVVESYEPQGNAVAVNSNLRIVFDQPMVRNTVERCLQVAPQALGQFRWVGARTVLFDPDSDLLPDTDYEVVLQPRARSQEGVELGRRLNWVFHTAAAPGLVASAQAANTRGGGVAITVQLSGAADLTVTVLNLAGRAVAQLPPQSGQAGANTLLWDGRAASGGAVPPGPYLVRVIARATTGASAQCLTALRR